MQSQFNRKTSKKASAKRSTLTVRPKSIDDVIKVIQHPKRFPSPVRPVGSDSGSTRINRVHNGTIIDMTSMNRIIKQTDTTVTVQAGVRLHDLSKHLAEDNKELVGTVDLPNRTVGGAVCSGILATSLPDDPDHLSSSVVSIIIVSPTGEKVEITEDHKRYMHLFRLSYGLTGIICHLTLRIRPIRSYQVNTTKLVLSELAEVVPDLSEVPVGIKMHIMPFRNRAWVELRRACDEPRPIRNLPWKIKEWARSSAVPKFVDTVNKAFSVSGIKDPLIDGITEVTQKLFVGNFADYGNNAQELSGKFATLRKKSGRKVYCSWAFREEDFGNVLRQLRSFSMNHYRDQGFRCDLPAVAFRMKKNQDAILSPAFESQVYVLKFESTAARGWDDFLIELAEFAQSHNGIPLFNQTRGLTTEGVAQAFGLRLKAFRNARQKLDPDGRMLNQFFSEYMS